MNGRAFGLLLLLFSIALRIAVPSGWMPAGDGLDIMPCTALASPATAHHPQSGHHDGSVPARPHGQTCAFTAFAVPLLAPVEPWTPPAFLLAASWIAAGLAISLVIGRPLAAPPPPQTGPPASF